MQSAVVGAVRAAASRYRWTVCAAVFRDRHQLHGSADPRPARADAPARHRLQYGRIVMAFSAFYALGLLGFGRIVDRLGTRISYALAMLVWSIAAMLHAAVGSVMGFAFVRALLDRRGNFPAAIKTTAEWFPRRERALATGIQLGREHRRGVRAGDHPGDRGGLRLRGVRDRRRDRHRVARGVARALSPGRYARARRGVRRAARRSGSARRGECECRRAALGRTDPQARDVGVPDRQVP